MAGFAEVFPCGWVLHFQHRLDVWTVNEQYCVQPGCSCTATALSFLRVVRATGKNPRVIRRTPTLRYNCRSRPTELVDQPRVCQLPGELLAVIKSAPPDLDRQLERRHFILQLLYARHYQAQAKVRWKSLLKGTGEGDSPFPAVSAIGGESSGRLKPLLPLPLKVGRNDPCPCGSGRKYKRCCPGRSALG